MKSLEMLAYFSKCFRVLRGKRHQMHHHHRAVHVGECPKPTKAVRQLQLIRARQADSGSGDQCILNMYGNYMARIQKKIRKKMQDKIRWWDFLALGNISTATKGLRVVALRSTLFLSCLAPLPPTTPPPPPTTPPPPPSPTSPASTPPPTTPSPTTPPPPTTPTTQPSAPVCRQTNTSGKVGIVFK